MSVVFACSMKRELYSLAEWVNIKCEGGGARADGWKCVTRPPPADRSPPPPLEGFALCLAAEKNNQAERERAHTV